jgi:hypothetical protein
MITRSQDPDAKITSIRAANKFFSEDKDRTFEAKVLTPPCNPEWPLNFPKMTDENARLLTLQQQLEKDADGKIAFFGSSVNETIRICLVNGMSKKADKIKADFKVPDKR